MVSTGNGKGINEIREESGSVAVPSVHGSQDDSAFYINASQRGLLDEKKRGKLFQNTVSGLPRFMKFGSFSKSPSSSKFWRVADQGEEMPCPTASPHRHDSTSLSVVPFIRKINWASLWEISKQWIRNPLNMALFVWIACVGISGAILFLVMTGMLNGALPEKSQRDTWFEVNNQILNALFTLMCLYQHPKRFHHLILLCRWRSEDILKLRKVYCKNGTEKPNEWKHMMVVVVLLHVNCFAQYALCGLNIGYSRPQRPPIGVGLCISVAIGAPAIASVYNILSPLGKEYETEADQESQGQVTSDLKTLDKKYFVMSREEHRTPVSAPEWAGGLFDFWDDVSLAYMSVFCSCCVFGWNMDRLGFGNIYVHIVTFLLFCLAPFFIFNLAAINIENEAVREILGISGFVLCILGLLYGGFWRIQLRKRFNLPGNGFCCGRPAVTDCFQWLCCCSCSLAQEVRTADYYDVVGDKLYLKETSDDSRHTLSPLPREDGSAQFRSSPSYPLWSSPNSHVSMQHMTSFSQFPDGHSSENHLPTVEEGSSNGGKNSALKPPVSHVMQIENSRHL